jgi:hypothetical protein
MQTPISQGVMTIHPPLKCLSGGAVDTGPMSDPPSKSFQRSTGWALSMQMPTSKGVMNAPSVGTRICQRSSGSCEPAKGRDSETASRDPPSCGGGEGGQDAISISRQSDSHPKQPRGSRGSRNRKPELLESCSSLSFSPCSPCSPWLGRRISGLSHLPELFLLRRVTCLGSLTVS